MSCLLKIVVNVLKNLVKIEKDFLYIANVVLFLLIFGFLCPTGIRAERANCTIIPCNYTDRTICKHQEEPCLNKEDITNPFNVEPDEKATKLIEPIEHNFYSTICWIEITKVKDVTTDTGVERFVTREYGITLESPSDFDNKFTLKRNSSYHTILNRSKNATFDEEIEPIEIYESDTKKSAIVNFTTVSISDNVKIREHQKKFCGAGPILISETHEWPNSRHKKLEIRVSPMKQKLKAVICKKENKTKGTTSTPSDVEVYLTNPTAKTIIAEDMLSRRTKMFGNDTENDRVTSVDRTAATQITSSLLVDAHNTSILTSTTFNPRRNEKTSRTTSNEYPSIVFLKKTTEDPQKTFWPNISIGFGDESTTPEWVPLNPNLSHTSMEIEKLWNTTKNNDDKSHTKVVPSTNNLNGLSFPSMGDVDIPRFPSGKNATRKGITATKIKTTKAIKKNRKISYGIPVTTESVPMTYRDLVDETDTPTYFQRIEYTNTPSETTTETFIPDTRNSTPFKFGPLDTIRGTRKKIPTSQNKVKKSHEQVVDLTTKFLNFEVNTLIPIIVNDITDAVQIKTTRNVGKYNQNDALYYAETPKKETCQGKGCTTASDFSETSTKSMFSSNFESIDRGIKNKIPENQTVETETTEKVREGSTISQKTAKVLNNLNTHYDSEYVELPETSDVTETLSPTSAVDVIVETHYIDIFSASNEIHTIRVPAENYTTPSEIFDISTEGSTDNTLLTNITKEYRHPSPTRTSTKIPTKGQMLDATEMNFDITELPSVTEITPRDLFKSSSIPRNKETPDIYSNTEITTEALLDYIIIHPATQNSRDYNLQKVNKSDSEEVNTAETTIAPQTTVFGRRSTLSKINLIDGEIETTPATETALNDITIKLTEEVINNPTTVVDLTEKTPRDINIKDNSVSSKEVESILNMTTFTTTDVNFNTLSPKTTPPSEITPSKSTNQAQDPDDVTNFNETQDLETILKTTTMKIETKSNRMQTFSTLLTTTTVPTITTSKTTDEFTVPEDLTTTNNKSSLGKEMPMREKSFETSLETSSINTKKRPEVTTVTLLQKTNLNSGFTMFSTPNFEDFVVSENMFETEISAQTTMKNSYAKQNLELSTFSEGPTFSTPNFKDAVTSYNLFQTENNVISKEETTNVPNKIKNFEINTEKSTTKTETANKNKSTVLTTTYPSSLLKDNNSTLITTQSTTSRAEIITAIDTQFTVNQNKDVEKETMHSLELLNERLNESTLQPLTVTSVNLFEKTTKSFRGDLDSPTSSQSSLGISETRTSPETITTTKQQDRSNEEIQKSYSEFLPSTTTFIDNSIIDSSSKPEYPKDEKISLENHTTLHPNTIKGKIENLGQTTQGIKITSSNKVDVTNTTSLEFEISTSNPTATTDIQEKITFGTFQSNFSTRIPTVDMEDNLNTVKYSTQTMIKPEEIPSTQQSIVGREIQTENPERSNLEQIEIEHKTTTNELTSQPTIVNRYEKITVVHDDNISTSTLDYSSDRTTSFEKFTNSEGITLTSSDIPLAIVTRNKAEATTNINKEITSSPPYLPKEIMIVEKFTTEVINTSHILTENNKFENYTEGNSTETMPNSSTILPRNSRLETSTQIIDTATNLISLIVQIDNKSRVEYPETTTINNVYASLSTTAAETDTYQKNKNEIKKDNTSNRTVTPADVNLSTMTYPKHITSFGDYKTLTTDDSSEVSLPAVLKNGKETTTDNIQTTGSDILSRVPVSDVPRVTTRIHKDNSISNYNDTAIDVSHFNLPESTTLLNIHTGKTTRIEDLTTSYTTGFTKVMKAVTGLPEYLTPHTDADNTDKATAVTQTESQFFDTSKSRTTISVYGENASPKIDNTTSLSNHSTFTTGTTKLWSRRTVTPMDINTTIIPITATAGTPIQRYNNSLLPCETRITTTTQLPNCYAANNAEECVIINTHMSSSPCIITKDLIPPNSVAPNSVAPLICYTYSVHINSTEKHFCFDSRTCSKPYLKEHVKMLVKFATNDLFHDKLDNVSIQIGREDTKYSDTVFLPSSKTLSELYNNIDRLLTDIDKAIPDEKAPCKSIKDLSNEEANILLNKLIEKVYNKPGGYLPSYVPKTDNKYLPYPDPIKSHLNPSYVNEPKINNLIHMNISKPLEPEFLILKKKNYNNFKKK